MAITLENYKTVFSDLENKVSQIDDGGINKIKETLDKIKSKAADIRNGGDNLCKDNSILKIGIVGQVKAGKSSFLNSLFFNGENVLPRASTPMTAGLTVLRYGEKNEFEVEYYNREEWQTFENKAKEYDELVREYKAETKNPTLTDEEAAREIGIDPETAGAKELVSKCKVSAINNIQETSKKETKPFDDINGLQNTLEKYVGAEGVYTPIVKCLTINLNDERLKDIQIVDTPGVNDPVVSRELRTKEFLSECHGVFLLSYSGRFFDSTDVAFLVDRIGSQGIGEVVLIASKFDSVLQDVGMKYQDDLGSALDYCQRSLKKQYERNIASSEFNGNDPLLDFSSGIGYSISHKDENRWDATERHVVEQMKSFYPSFFDTMEDIKGTFNNLSQIDDIRDKYVDKLFKSRRDEIIRDKVNAYFKKANDNISRIISGEYANLNDYLTTLRSADIEGLQESKKVLETVIKNMRDDISSIVNRVDSNISRIIKECLNSFRFTYDGNVPTTTQQRSFKRESTILGRNREFSYSYEVANKTKLISIQETKLNSALSSLSDIWKKKVEEIKKSIYDALNKVITEGENSSDRFDARALRNRVAEALASIDNMATINTKILADNFKDTLSRKLQNSGEVVVSKFGEMSESEAKDKAQEAARNAIQDVQRCVDEVISSVGDDVKNALHKAGQDCIGIITTGKNEFFGEIEKSTRKDLDEMKKNIADSERTIAVFENALNGLKELKKEFA